MSGSSGFAYGVYGTLGTAAASNVPGSRANPTAWIDASDNLWLFGGSNSGGYFNDLWKYSPGTGWWTWMSGSSGQTAAGTYGSLGTPASTNVPGVRSGATSWTDGSGNLWLFGGKGYAATTSVTDPLNDLWKYPPGTGWWTWMSGSNTVSSAGSYGTLGTAAASNAPPARSSKGAAWMDGSGRLWLFGGAQCDIYCNHLNDLWRYQP
jgi:hypothetical protein